MSIGAASKPGESGGGLFDPDGYLVGVLYSTLEGSTEIMGHGLVDKPKSFKFAAPTTTFTHAHLGSVQCLCQLRA